MTNSLLAFGLLIFSTHTLADIDAYNAAGQKLCEKAKQCTYEQMDGENLNPQMRKMVEGMLENVCQRMMQVAEPAGFEELVEPATACLESMQSMSCAEFEDQSEPTQACKEYEEIAKEYEKG